MTPEQLAQFNDMRAFIESLKSSSTIPFAVDAAFTDRLSLKNLQDQTVKTPTSENVAIFVSPTTYTALGAPDGFLLLVDNGTYKYIPYYT